MLEIKSEVKSLLELVERIEETPTLENFSDLLASLGGLNVAVVSSYYVVKQQLGELNENDARIRIINHFRLMAQAALDVFDTLVPKAIPLA